MSLASERWSVELSDLAGRDFTDILAWTANQMGVRQALTYEATLTAALEALIEGPNPAGSKARDDLLKGLRSLRVARLGRRGSHVIMFRVESFETRRIGVVRILHERMDFARHLNAEEPED